MAATNQQQQTNTFDAPPYEANWIVDEAHKPETIIDRHGRNAQSPAAHEVYKRAVTEKAEKFGVIHVDPATGYRARFKPQSGGQGARASDTGGGQGGGAANGRAASSRDRKRDQAGAGGGPGGDDRDARIADLERQLADARGPGGGQA
jgi:hypothetical protein